MTSITNVKGTFTLNNGIKMPYLGLGVFECKNNDEVINAVSWAINAGYRHIDTAAIYRNEDGVGAGIRHSGVHREDIFVTSKVWNADQGYESTIHAFEHSLNLLELDYLDLYLIHWPVNGKFIETWKALEYLYREERVRAIGVSNFMEHHLESLLNEAEVVPMVNQMEFHPYLVQQDLLDYCRSKGIQYESWSPLMKGRVLEVDLLKELAAKYQKTIVQVVLRWNLQKGVVTIPKSARKERIISNADLFDFFISEEDMKRIDSLDRNLRVGPNPDNFDF
jgi:diketogulonate reductase-like aldo/keto reductase